MIRNVPVSANPGPAAAVASPPASGYFVDQKKGEVNELKGLLKNINVERDVHKKKEILKKVIAYMTLGIDVSRLFTEMIMVHRSIIPIFTRFTNPFFH